MTDHSNPSDSSNFSDSSEPQAGDHDPAIAERFRVLDRVTPPAVSRPPMAGATPGESIESDPSGHRSGFLLAVAACVGVLVVGLAAMVAVNGGDDTDLTDLTEQAGEVPVATDESADTTAPLVVEGDESGAVSTTRSAGDDAGSSSDDDSSTANGDSDTGSAAERPAAGGSDADGSNGDEGVNTDDASDSDSDDGDPSSGSTDSGDSGPLVTSPDAPPGMPAADGDRPVSTFLPKTTDAPPAGGDGVETVSIRGTVTEVLTDCVSRLVLSDAGKVVDGGPVTCDGGSYILVDGTRVFTSSGYTSADLAYDKHPSNLKPGQQVSVTAARADSGPLTLNCDTCRVRIG